MILEDCKRRKKLLFPGLAFICGFVSAQPSVVVQEVADGFSQPLLVTHAGDGSGRIFAVERRGRIRIVDSGGTVLGTDFLNVGSSGLNLIQTSGSEQGLLGLAFHPDYPSNGRFFISYTERGTGDSIVSEFSVSADSDVAEVTETIILGPIFQPESNHNGGHITFGPVDGMLYFSIGDGGGGGDNHGMIGNGQDTTNLLGNILRIDVDSGSPFVIPPDNPFVGVGGARDEIFAYGLRNPWRFSFDRGGANRIFCADVGQGAWEEVSIIASGGNYGWRCREGAHDFNTSTPNCATAALIDPIHEYAQRSTPTNRCSITGGYVYRGPSYPNFVGLYFFGDFCSGEIWTLEEVSPGDFDDTLQLDTPFAISSFGEDEAGEIYVCGYSDGRIYQIVDANQPPQPEIELSVAEMDFGEVTVGTESPLMEFQISNQGSLDLEINDLFIQGTDSDQFLFSPDPPDTSNLMSMQSRDIGIRFQPDSEGFKTANVVIETNDLDEPSESVIVSGTGTAVVSTVLHWELY